jgi:hypothetical protein
MGNSQFSAGRDGALGQTQQFDGLEDWLNLGENSFARFNAAQSFTLATWVRPDFPVFPLQVMETSYVMMTTIIQTATQ